MRADELELITLFHGPCSIVLAFLGKAARGWAAFAFENKAEYLVILEDENIQER